MNSKATTVDQYMSELPAGRQAALVQLRALINQVAPDASEGMDYGMPVFGDICAFASQKHYMALYCDTNVVNSYRLELGNLNCGKCCIRFKHIEDLPMTVIKKILKDTMELRANGVPPKC